jgi:hypothetical protein
MRALPLFPIVTHHHHHQRHWLSELWLSELCGLLILTFLRCLGVTILDVSLGFLC